jgi:hypothetical protein
MGFTELVAIVGVVSGVLGIIGYFLPIGTAKARYLHGAYVLVIVLLVSYGTYQATRYARLNDIARNATRLSQEAYSQQFKS